MEAENFFTISDISNGPIKVSGICLESNPCQHHVSVDDGEYKSMGALSIIKLFQERSLEVPSHFNYLIKPRVRVRPTLEQKLLMREKAKRELQRHEERRAQRVAERLKEENCVK